jgi:hypothetical protein
VIGEEPPGKRYAAAADELEDSIDGHKVEKTNLQDEILRLSTLASSR